MVCEQVPIPVGATLRWAACLDNEGEAVTIGGKASVKDLQKASHAGRYISGTKVRVFAKLQRPSVHNALLDLIRWQAPNFLDLSQLQRLLKLAHACWLESRQAPGSHPLHRLSDVLGLIALHVRLTADLDRRLSSVLAPDFVLGNFGCGADSLWCFVQDVLNVATDTDVLSAALNVLRSGTHLMDAERCADALEAILGRLNYQDLPDTASSVRFAVISTLVDALEASNAFSKLFIGRGSLAPRAQVLPFFTCASTRFGRGVCILLQSDSLLFATCVR